LLNVTKEGAIVKKLYAAGWVKTGAVGVLDHTVRDSNVNLFLFILFLGDIKDNFKRYPIRRSAFFFCRNERNHRYFKFFKINILEQRRMEKNRFNGTKRRQTFRKNTSEIMFKK
jgi:hypothetical protein